MDSKEKIRLLKDYIAVVQGEMSKLFFCERHDINFREFTKIAYVIEAELVAENEKLKGSLETIDAIARNCTKLTSPLYPTTLKMIRAKAKQALKESKE